MMLAWLKLSTLAKHAHAGLTYDKTESIGIGMHAYLHASEESLDKSQPKTSIIKSYLIFRPLSRAFAVSK